MVSQKVNLCHSAEAVVISTDVAVVNTLDVFKLKEMCYMNCNASNSSQHIWHKSNKLNGKNLGIIVIGCSLVSQFPPDKMLSHGKLNALISTKFE